MDSSIKREASFIWHSDERELIYKLRVFRKKRKRLKITTNGAILTVLLTSRRDTKKKHITKATDDNER